MEIKSGKFALAFVLSCVLPFMVFAQDEALVQGYETYRAGDWNSAGLFLRRAVLDEENSTDSVWYMIVMSSIYSENFEGALADCEYFIREFSDSPLIPYVIYQKGRALHYVGQNDSAVLCLSDFCHQYPENDLYSSALYWLAECFYDDYNYETARSLYEKIIADFPDSSKVEDSKFKLEVIGQKDREQKLLYLLKMTGEEYLSSREAYEKQLKELQTEDSIALRKQLAAANARIRELEEAAASSLNAVQQIMEKDEELIEFVSKEEVKPVEPKIEQKTEPKVEVKIEQKPEPKVEVKVEQKIEPKPQVSNNDENLLILKRKAALLQNLLNEKNGGK